MTSSCEKTHHFTRKPVVAEKGKEQDSLKSTLSRKCDEEEEHSLVYDVHCYVNPLIRPIGLFLPSDRVTGCNLCLSS